MGLEYTIKYKKGKENIVADALSRRGIEEGNLHALSTAVPMWANDISGSYTGDTKVQQIITTLLLNPTLPSKYSYQQGIVRYKGRIYIGSVGDLKKVIVNQMHATALGGHSGIDNTYKRLKQLFYWPGMKLDVENRVKDCEVCIKNKVDGIPYAGLLQPIPIPTQAWQLVSMDFIEALP